MDTTKLEQLLGKLTPSLQHLDQKVLAARPFLASEQLSLADLIAFTDLMQVRFCAGLPSWGLWVQR